LTDSCNKIALGQGLDSWQQSGLELVSRLHGGRDVLLALDLTQSVQLNDEGRIRLRQIIEDSLQPGDSVYVVPFASSTPSLPKAIDFRGKQDIEEILQTVKLEADLNLQNTDIQLAELSIYRELAQLNQCRLLSNQGIKPQSVVWLTDAPLNTKPGITSNIWVETPKHSPFRDANSPESQERKQWLGGLPFKPIKSKKIENYQLTIVDLPPTVQEFCTPAPGGREVCLVTPYLLRQLWLPTTILILILIGSGFWVKYFLSLQKRWVIKITFESDGREDKSYLLAHQQRLAIGDQIECPGSEIRGYLKRDGNRIYLQPTGIAPIYYKDREITKTEKLEGSYFRINCPYNNREFELKITIEKNS
jgi:hypothetical protein